MHFTYEFNDLEFVDSGDNIAGTLTIRLFDGRRPVNGESIHALAAIAGGAEAELPGFPQATRDGGKAEARVVVPTANPKMTLTASLDRDRRTQNHWASISVPKPAGEKKKETPPKLKTIQFFEQRQWWDDIGNSHMSGSARAIYDNGTEGPAEIVIVEGRNRPFRLIFGDHDEVSYEHVMKFEGRPVTWHAIADSPGWRRLDVHAVGRDITIKNKPRFPGALRRPTWLLGESRPGFRGAMHLFTILMILLVVGLSVRFSVNGFHAVATEIAQPLPEARWHEEALRESESLRAYYRNMPRWKVPQAAQPAQHNVVEPQYPSFWLPFLAWILIFPYLLLLYGNWIIFYLRRWYGTLMASANAVGHEGSFVNQVERIMGRDTPSETSTTPKGKTGMIWGGITEFLKMAATDFFMEKVIYKTPIGAWITGGKKDDAKKVA